jgi:hypothetical protein
MTCYASDNLSRLSRVSLKEGLSHNAWSLNELLCSPVEDTQREEVNKFKISEPTKLERPSANAGRRARWSSSPELTDTLINISRGHEPGVLNRPHLPLGF